MQRADQLCGPWIPGWAAQVEANVDGIIWYSLYRGTAQS